MSWQSLPTELKHAIADVLDDVLPLSRVDRTSYSVTLPALYRNIKLNSPARLNALLAHVPPHYLAQTASIDVELGSGGADLAALLAVTPRLKSLTVASAGRLTPSLLAVSLPHLNTLSLTNIDPHGLCPLSERLVASFCLSLSALSALTLCGITRSALHAPPCFFPVVRGDEDIPPHATAGADLSLPNILRITSLKTLVIKETPLCDDRWETVPVSCNIEHVELEGSDADRVLARIGPSVRHVSLGVSAPPRAPCPVLTRLHMTPYFPPDALAPTFTSQTLCSSPITRVDVECFADDLSDLCHAVSDFLVVRQKSPSMWRKLERIDVRILKGEETPCDEDALEAMARLIRLCTELKLRCDSLKALRKWPDGRLRANTV